MCRNLLRFMLDRAGNDACISALNASANLGLVLELEVKNLDSKVLTDSHN